VTGAGSRHDILLVEDDPSVRDLVAGHLERQGHDVTSVGAAETVLRELRSRGLDYDVALVDVHLPGMSGVELIRLLLATRPLSPVIMVTGDDDASVAREALEQGVSAYLLKPFQMFELDAALAQALSVLDLVETTEALALSRSEGLGDPGERGGALPPAWLDLCDGMSEAGPGHGERVAGLADLLADACGLPLNARDRALIGTAARTHEVGRLTGTGAPERVPHRSAQLLSDLRFDPDVAELVRQGAEPWSPGLPPRARVLGLADRLDHEAARRVARGDGPDEAIRGAVTAMIRRAGDDIDPELGRALSAERERIESMWVLGREPLPA
jgi:CheY-like chemotaxis protein